MQADCIITQRLLASQRTMFRLAERDHGISQKLVSLETGMSLSAVGQYARGETAMSGPAILKLAGMEQFPAALVSLLFDGTGRCVIDEPTGDLCHDTLAGQAIGYVGKHAQARHPESPGGVQIVPEEKRELDAGARSLKATA